MTSEVSKPEVPLPESLLAAAIRPSSGLGSDYATAVDTETLLQLIDRLCAHDDSLAQSARRLDASSRSLVEYTSHQSTQIILSEDGIIEDNEAWSSKYVAVHSVVRSASKVFTLIFLGSLVLWACSGVALINPFATVLGLIACPFFYLMANVVQQEE